MEMGDVPQAEKKNVCITGTKLRHPNPVDRDMMQETTQIGSLSVGKVMHDTPRASYPKQNVGKALRSV
jgi:hypothetical protein